MQDQQQKKRNAPRRRGAVTVEFAIVAPVFVTVMLGVSQASRMLEARNQMDVAAREGARLAAMDRSGMLGEGQTTNQKVENDIRKYLDASGLSGDDASVHIVDPVDHTTTFDLDDPANDLKLFELRVELPYTSTSTLSCAMGDDAVLTSKVVFRNARAVVVQ